MTEGTFNGVNNRSRSRFLMDECQRANSVWHWFTLILVLRQHATWIHRWMSEPKISFDARRLGTVLSTYSTVARLQPNRLTWVVLGYKQVLQQFSKITDCQAKNKIDKTLAIIGDELWRFALWFHIHVVRRISCHLQQYRWYISTFL